VDASRRPITLDFRKTHGNSVRWLVCRKTFDFMTSGDLSLIGRFLPFAEKD